jgi:mono/diheme cytochrome c family protein
MSFGEHVFLYCERGRSEALLAEPLNAASNAAFVLAALAALLLLLRRPKEDRSADVALLIALVFLIGLGSLAFHLLADKGTLLADVIPIDVFMLVYLGFALNRLLRVPPGWTVLLLIGFAGLMFWVGQLKCWAGGIGFPAPEVTGASECLNGSLIYLPALAAKLEAATSTAEVAASSRGARLYQGACAVCHEVGGPPLFGSRPSLALNSNLHSAMPDNLIQVILHGITDPVTSDLGYMPPFKHSMTDAQVAELVSYLRRQFAPGKPAWSNIEALVGRIRQGTPRRAAML